jgi:L-amino acid N-acyltransferase YncA
MTKEEISQISEIDHLNMSEFFMNSGKHFDVELRKSGITNEVDNGAVFYLVKESKMVVGYIEYIEREEKILTIKSVQIHPSKWNGFTLRKLIEGIYPRFKSSFKDHQIISAAHRINKRTISLHKKLGFVETEIEDDMITYRCKGIELLTKLEKYIKNKF